MNEDSGFFAGQEPLPAKSGAMECIHRSEYGWSELYRIDKGGRFRVLKALKPEFRDQDLYVQLLRKEYEIGYSLSHPAICEVYGYSVIPGLGYAIEMEWVDGCTLEQLIQEGRISRKESRRIILQLCDALSYLHSKQIVHRDLKPSNILVTHNGKNVKIIDFGLSDSDSYVALKGAAGTRSFAAPEILSGQTGDWRSDIWSLGKIIRLLPPSRAILARKCMAADPRKRYSDASEVAAELRRPMLLWALPLFIAALALVLWFALHKGPAPAEPRQDSDISTMVSDPAVIDELFRQATEMIE